MADVVDPQTRSRMMAGIGARNTSPELLVRSLLHRAGYRFRLHVASLPGKPDIVLPKYKAVLLVNGCFWHAHGCPLFKLPASRREFWKLKLDANKARDRNNIVDLQALGWRVLVVWECALKGRGRLADDQIVLRTQDWLLSYSDFGEIQGQK